MKSRRYWWSVVLVAAVAVAVALGVWITAREPVPAAVEAPAPSEPAAASAAPVAQVPLTPEEQAKQDLDKLVREYYAAENEVYLDASKDPSAALDPYLRNPASGAKIGKILTFRDARHVLEESKVEVHSVAVTQVDLAAEPPTAALEECHTMSASGVDGESGEPASFSNRRLTEWTAVLLPNGSWRLNTYDNGEVGSC